MDDLYLIYVNVLGEDWKDDYVYEFIFSDTIEGVDGHEWDAYPAMGNPKPPNKQFVKRVGRLETQMLFDVIQNSDSMAVWDAVDGLMAMAWENIDEYDEYPETRMFFKYGEDIKMVEDKLYERDLILNYNITEKWSI